MNISFIILCQIIVMFILMAIGYFLFKANLLTKEGSKSIANILIYFTLPCVILNSFLSDKTEEKVYALIISAVLAFICLLISGIISRLLFKKNPIDVFSSTFSNPGFFGIPIIASLYDSAAAFNITIFIAFLNIGQWTYGVALLKGGKIKLKAKTLYSSPFIIATLIGLFFFFSSLKMPSIIKTAVASGSNANTLLAMLVLGVYLAQTDIKDILINKKVYLVSLSRLIIIPLVSLLVLCLLDNKYMELKTCLLIASACPVGANVAVYAQIYDSDYQYAVKTVTQSTILSVITIPAILLLAQYIW